MWHNDDPCANVGLRAAEVIAPKADIVGHHPSKMMTFRRAVDEVTARAVAKLLASKFIARPDVHAIQRSNGDWNPVNGAFTMAHLRAHLTGEASYGHYMMNKDSEVKLFAFDIDLQKATPDKNIFWPVPKKFDEDAGDWTEFTDGDPRHEWENLSTYPKWVEDFYIYQLTTCAKRLVRAIQDTLEIPVAVAYSGHKGMHVYGFTGLCSGNEAREAALIALDHTQQFQPWRGNNFFVGKSVEFDENFRGWPQLSIEIFPKQGQISEGGYGNLMRLPLGKNLLKSNNNPHEAKFVDIRTGSKWGMLERHPLEALTTENPWAGEL